jgi:hypothetical protein
MGLGGVIGPCRNDKQNQPGRSATCEYALHDREARRHCLSLKSSFLYFSPVRPEPVEG